MLDSCVKSYPENAPMSPAPTMPTTYWMRAQISSPNPEPCLGLVPCDDHDFLLKTALKILAMNAPMEPFAGLAMDGAAGFSTGIGVTEIGGAIVAPVNVMEGQRHHRHQQPAQPGWLSMTLIVDPVTDILAGPILIGAGPDVRRRPPARGVAEPIYCSSWPASGQCSSPCCVRHAGHN